MKTRLSALVAAAVLGAAVMSPALAYDGRFEGPSQYMGFSPDAAETTESVLDGRGPTYFGCPMNSAAEGNANQQAFPVQQYGQTSGGSAC